MRISFPLYPTHFSHVSAALLSPPHTLRLVPSSHVAALNAPTLVLLRTRVRVARESARQWRSVGWPWPVRVPISDPDRTNFDVPVAHLLSLFMTLLLRVVYIRSPLLFLHTSQTTEDEEDPVKFHSFLLFPRSLPRVPCASDISLFLYQTTIRLFLYSREKHWRAWPGAISAWPAGVATSPLRQSRARGFLIRTFRRLFSVPCRTSQHLFISYLSLIMKSKQTVG